jgi:hypothetical protein
MAMWWLRCEVLPGPFSTERIVILRARGGESTQERDFRIIVDSGLVRADEQLREDRAVAGRVRVVRGRTSVDTADVLLPAASEVGSVVAVPAARLEEAEA